MAARERRIVIVALSVAVVAAVVGIVASLTFGFAAVVPALVGATVASVIVSCLFIAADVFLQGAPASGGLQRDMILFDRSRLQKNSVDVGVMKDGQ